MPTTAVINAEPTPEPPTALRSVSDAFGPLRPLVTRAEAGVDARFASESLRPLRPQAVAATLRALSADAERLRQLAGRSYWHANGFLKVPLAVLPTLRIRLHYWPARRRAEENAHDHRWDMASRVLSGRLDSEEYRAVPPGASADDGLATHAYIYRKARPGLAAEVVPLGTRWLVRTRRTSRGAGEVYALPHDVPHRIVKRDDAPTVTLMVQSPPVRDHNLMYRWDAARPDVRPTPLSTADLADQLDAIARVLESEGSRR